MTFTEVVRQAQQHSELRFQRFNTQTKAAITPSLYVRQWVMYDGGEYGRPVPSRYTPMVDDILATDWVLL